MRKLEIVRTLPGSEIALLSIRASRELDQAEEALKQSVQELWKAQHQMLMLWSLGLQLLGMPPSSMTAETQEAWTKRAEAFIRWENKSQSWSKEIEQMHQEVRDLFRTMNAANSAERLKRQAEREAQKAAKKAEREALRAAKKAEKEAQKAMKKP